MALRSMTGFGRGSAAAHGLSVGVEISSVNRRQFDNQVSVPRALEPLESRITEEIQAHIQRGRLTGEIKLQHTQSARRHALRIDEELAASYVRELRGAAKRLGIPDDVTIRTLMEFPEVVQFAHPEADLEKAWPVVQRALRQALHALVRMRTQEGRALEKDLRERTEGLRGQVARIRELAPAVAEQYRRNLLERIRAAGVEAALNDDRLVREVALYADRCDITEELTRLDSHLDHWAALVRARDANGKSLDFLAQEMFREINTIGSKANDAGIVQIVVGFKSELERVREQVQNIE